MPRQVPLEEFKLMVLSPDEFFDEEIARIFPDVVVASEDDIHESTQLLATHRPRAAEMIADKYFGGQFFK